MEGRSIGSIPSGYSTWMNRSSAGASSKAPPQTMQPLVLAATDLISSMERFTGQSVSTRSAVPAGEVMAREDVLEWCIQPPPQWAQLTCWSVARMPPSCVYQGWVPCQNQWFSHWQPSPLTTPIRQCSSRETQRCQKRRRIYSAQVPFNHIVHDAREVFFAQAFAVGLALTLKRDSGRRQGDVNFFALFCSNA